MAWSVFWAGCRNLVCDRPPGNHSSSTLKTYVESSQYSLENPADASNTQPFRSAANHLSGSS